MLDKARSNMFSIFMRKIGFSVGLEHTLDRLMDFARLYSSKDTLSYADVSRLLHSKKPLGWGLDANNEHILDVFRSLGVIDVRRGEVAVLEVGDSLGVLSKNLSDNEELKSCTSLIFTHALLLADGDVFLNALSASFDPEEFSQKIVSSIEHKWSILEQHFTTDRQRELIYSAINIEMQANNPGSRGKKSLSQLPDPNRLSTIRPPLSTSTRRPEITLSYPYLAKALPRRKAWAISLGLADDDGLVTEKGRDLLTSLISAGYAGQNCFSLWPLEHELSSHNFGSVRSGAFPVMNSWEFLLLVGRGTRELPPHCAQLTSDDVMDTLESIIATYKSLNQSKSIVRAELPVRVAYRCVVGNAVLTGKLPDLPKIIDQEQLSPSPRVIARPSRLAEFALSTSN